MSAWTKLISQKNKPSDLGIVISYQATYIGAAKYSTYECRSKAPFSYESR